MTEGAPAEVDIRYFSWRYALTGDYDVLHLHWPEFLIRARSRRMRLAKQLAMRALLVRARARHIAIVRTTHNVKPHESASASEARVVSAVDRATTIFIHLNGSTVAPGPGEEAVIPHGHYRDRFAAYPQAARVEGRVLYFGIIRPRKNVEHLIDVFLERERPGCHLRIVGSPTPELRVRIEGRIAGHSDVSASLAFVDDDELVREVTEASLIVLPYSEMHNSGAALVALSLDRPVLVPRSPANDELRREVGAQWVIPFDGALDDDDLTSALRAASTLAPDVRPSLEGRDWDEVGRQHHDVYRRAVARVRKGNR